MGRILYTKTSSVNEKEEVQRVLGLFNDAFSNAYSVEWEGDSGTLSPRVRRPGHEADHSPPYDVEV
jgi:hypothetical protein